MILKVSDNAKTHDALLLEKHNDAFYVKIYCWVKKDMLIQFSIIIEKIKENK